MMQNELDILREVSERLEAAGIAFMLTGSVAMNYYAQPRMTRDIDLVVALEAADAETFVRLFEADYYLDRQAVRRAIARRSLINLIHNESVIKVDCIVLKRDAYRQEEFARRQRITLGDFQTWIVSRLCERMYGTEVDVAAFVAHLRSVQQREEQPDAAATPASVSEAP